MKIVSSAMREDSTMSNRIIASQGRDRQCSRSHLAGGLPDAFLASVALHSANRDGSLLASRVKRKGRLRAEAALVSKPTQRLHTSARVCESMACGRRCCRDH